MANVQLLDGNDVQKALERQGVDLFRYQLNRLGFTLILLVGGVMLAAAGFIWWQFGFGEHLWTAVFAGLTLGGLGISLLAAYWYTFASTRFVGVSDQKLIVGREEKAWAIDWSVLDAQKLGLGRMNATAMQGALEVHVAGEDIKIQLYNAYVFLDDIQALMSSLLEQLQRNQPDAGQLEQSPDELDLDERTSDEEAVSESQ